FLLVIIGMVPLLITMAYTSYDTVKSAFKSAEHELKVTNELIEKELFAMMIYSGKPLMIYKASL
ncbi:MAG: hypothetical protein J6T77_02000, partial [Clostridia bacterium]|nr:hypothetical protein [Clostridia bacterium]